MSQARVVPEPEPDRNNDIPEKSWSVPFSEGTWLHDQFQNVLKENRDFVIIIDDYWGRRGTGKTVGSLQIGSGLDQTEQGLTTAKTSLSPEEIRNAYTQQPKRSALILDEGEVGASNRQAMTKTNQALREVMSMGRVEQKYVIVNTPVRGFIDKDLQKLADVWISMMRKGLGLVHHLKWETYSESLHTPAKQFLEIEDIPTGTDLRDVYNALTKEKRQRMRGEDGGEFIPKDEHVEALEKARKEEHRDTRNQIITNILEHPKINVTQTDLADTVDVGSSFISKLNTTE